MTCFTVRGSRNGSLVHVTWTDGVLSGDPPTVDLLYTQADLVRVMRGDATSARAFPELVGSDTGDPDTDPLADPGGAYRLIRHVIDSVRTESGDLPPR